MPGAAGGVCVRHPSRLRGLVICCLGPGASGYPSTLGPTLQQVQRIIAYCHCQPAVCYKEPERGEPGSFEAHNLGQAEYACAPATGPSPPSPLVLGSTVNTAAISRSPGSPRTLRTPFSMEAGLCLVVDAPQGSCG
jgi:hypothetical protein